MDTAYILYIVITTACIFWFNFFFWQLPLVFLLCLKLYHLPYSVGSNVRNSVPKLAESKSYQKNLTQNLAPSKKLNQVSSPKQLIIESIKRKITHLSWKQRVSKVKWSATSIWLSDLPTNTIKCRIFCRSGYHLQIRRNGAVSGTLFQNSKYSKYLYTWS